MNVGSIGSTCATAMVTRAQNDGTSATQGSDSNGAVERGQGHHHHGGGLRDALMQALGSLGVSLPQPADGAGPPPPPGASGAGPRGVDPDGDGDGDRQAGGAGDAGRAVRDDMRAFMHELFSALRSESSGSAIGGVDGSTSASAAAPAPSLSSDLAALVSDVGNAKVPPGLQQAFDRLMADLNPSSSSPSSASSTSASGTPTLQQLLTAMQQDLGYGPGGASAGAMTGVGNAISVSA